LVKAAEQGLWVVAFPILVASAFFTPQLLTRSTSIDESRSAEPASITEPDVRETPAALPAGDPPGQSNDVVDSFTDLYGNEVTDAVATYTFDQSGSLYELHSPQTELPRLGIPKS
jgi:hypothetical protein